jgi:hypothetical protein
MDTTSTGGECSEFAGKWVVYGKCDEGVPQKGLSAPAL